MTNPSQRGGNSPNPLRARPTVYEGIEMRSRLEAWWAQRFDEAGRTWTYEPCAFAAPGAEQYLPDFLLEETRPNGRVKRIFIDMKGVVGPHELGRFLRRMEVKGADVSLLKRTLVIAVGPITARELEAKGIRPGLVPKEFKAEGVLAALGNHDLAGKRFLYPRAEVAREVLPEELERLGAHVHVAVAYRTVAPDVDPEYVRSLFSGGVSALTFTSSSTVKNFHALVGGDVWRSLAEGGVCVACIGPVTARTCEEMGLKVTVMPEEYTVPALFSSITKYFSKGDRNG